MLQHESEGSRRLRVSCDFCIQSKARCSKDKPSCRRCVRKSHSCVYGVARRAGRPRKSSQATDRGPEVDGQCRKPEPQGPPDWTMSTQVCLCQQHSGSFWGLDESGINFLLADTVNIARTEETIPTPKLDSGVQMESFFEPGLLRNDTLTPIDSSSNYLSDMFQGEAEGLMSGYCASTLDGRTRQGSMREMVATPTNTPPLPTNSASPRSNMGQENDEQHPTGRSDGTILFFSDIEKAFSEGPAFLELHSIIRFIVGNGQTDSEIAIYPVNPLHNSCLCFCSTATNKLLILVSHPALNPRSVRLPLDIAFFFENFIFEIHESVLKCLVCRTKSSYSRVFLCLLADWVIEILRNAVQSISSEQEAQDTSSVALDGVEDSSIIRVGRLDLDCQIQGLCTRSLIKHRLGRLVLTIDKMSKQDNEWRGAVLQQTVRIMTQEIHHKMKSILGMMEL